MDTKWLSIKSFNRDQSIIGAINTLIIYLIYEGKNLPEELSEEDVKNAKEQILKFLSDLYEHLDQLASKEKRLLGLDPREQNLVRSFDKARRAKQYNSKLFKEDQAKVVSLLNDFDLNNSDQIITFLEDLREIMEAHIQTDKQNLFPDI